MMETLHAKNSMICSAENSAFDWTMLPEKFLRKLIICLDRTELTKFRGTCRRFREIGFENSQKFHRFQLTRAIFFLRDPQNFRFSKIPFPDSERQTNPGQIYRPIVKFFLMEEKFSASVFRKLMKFIETYSFTFCKFLITEDLIEFLAQEYRNPAIDRLRFFRCDFRESRSGLASLKNLRSILTLEFDSCFGMNFSAFCDSNFKPIFAKFSDIKQLELVPFSSTDKLFITDYCRNSKLSIEKNIN